MNENIKRPTLEEFNKKLFTIDQFDVVEKSVIKSLEELSFYALKEVDLYLSTEREVLQPIYINSSYTRAVVMIGIKNRGRLSNTVHIGFAPGFRHEGEWHFLFGDYHPLLMEEPEGNVIDDYSFERISEIAIEKYFSKAIEYNREESTWEIDDSFIRNFIDNKAYMSIQEQVEGVDSKTKTEEYWLNVYKKFLTRRNRFIELTKMKWKDQDSLRRSGRIEDEEWLKLLGIRKPSTLSDWENLRSFRKELMNDSIIQSTLTSR